MENNMNYIKSVFVFLLLSLSSLAALAMPSVADVEHTIANGDYEKAKSQLNEVLKAQPDSYVANRYMLEIIKIENARDNVASVGYKIYEDKLARIEAAKAAKLAAIKKAEEEKLAKERAAKFRSFMWDFFRTLVVLAILFGGFLLGLKYHRRKQFQKEQKRKEQELLVAKGELMADLIDLNNLLNKGIDDPQFDGTSTLTLLNDLKLDNLDAINCLDNDDFNLDAVKRHVRNASEFLRRNGIEE